MKKKTKGPNKILKLVECVEAYGIFPCHFSLSGDDYLIRQSRFNDDTLMCNNPAMTTAYLSRQLCTTLALHIKKSTTTQEQTRHSQCNINLDLNPSSNGFLKLFPMSLMLLGEYVLKFTLKRSHLTWLPETFGKNFSNLQELDISNNELHFLPLSLFSFLIHLKRFNVSSNLLSIINENIGNLQNLSYFDASHNNIKTLPHSICNCQFLEAINLHHNSILNLPRELCLKLRHLKELNLEHNPVSNVK